jgi:hypothetical protein
MEMNIENVMVLLNNAIEKSYAENKNLNFGVFEDLHYDLCIQWKLECVENVMEDNSPERDEAFYARFGHLGSI